MADLKNEQVTGNLRDELLIARGQEADSEQLGSEQAEPLPGSNEINFAKPFYTKAYSKDKVAHDKPSGMSKPFCNPQGNEQMTVIGIVIMGAVVIPMSWQWAGPIVKSTLTMAMSLIGSATSWLYVLLGAMLFLSPFAIAIAYLHVSAWISSVRQANRIHLSEDGILLHWSTRPAKVLSWGNVSSVYLYRPNQSLIPERWSVGFKSMQDSRPVFIRLSAVQEVSSELMDFLNNRSAATIDPELIELLKPAIADSHTELWLKSLSKAPKEAELLPLFPGSNLKEGRYVILGRIGVGGQGTAYLAKDNQTGEEIVIKETLFPVYVDPSIRKEAVERFSREVELLKQLNHDYVVHMHDSFIEEHRGYLVMDYIDGLSLRQVVKKQGRLAENEVCRLAAQMAVILKYLHCIAPPVVHRDFTPDNLILNKNSQLILIDFNVARQLETTKTATVVGKHAYIPPEQYRGCADPRSDIYAFGATLYFLLTGNDPEPIAQSFPAEVDASISPSMNELVSKATAQELNERIQSAEEIERLVTEIKRQAGD